LANKFYKTLTFGQRQTALPKANQTSLLCFIRVSWRRVINTIIMIIGHLLATAGWWLAKNSLANSTTIGDVPPNWAARQKCASAIKIIMRVPS